MVPTIETVRSLLSYDRESGLFRWKVNRRGTARAGSIAGRVDAQGYVRISILRRLYQAHRLAWLLMHDSWPLLSIDHINGRRDDNRASNLRDVSVSMNALNQFKPHAHKQSSPFLGVYRKRNKWQSSIKVEGRHIHLGTFDSAEDADAAYRRAKQKVMEML